MTEAIAVGIAAVLVVPYVLPQSRLDAPTGIALWLSVFGLRAALALSLATVLILYLPATELFTLLTHWCVHAVVPFIATHLGLDGHRLGDVAILVPALVLAASTLWAAFGVWRGARAVHRWLRRHSLGTGPSSSVVVGGSDVMVAAAGLRDPRVVVSTGALLSLDDAELTAGLAHEWGHVTRRHRFISLAAQCLFAVSRPLPGGRRALERLHFQLERDADNYAVRRTGDRLALASAICKAVPRSSAAMTPALAELSGNGVPERLRLLMGEPRQASHRVATASARALATAAAALTLALGLSAPALASSGFDQLRLAESARSAGCE
jgi:Zn-dependent protease with chaperone function